MSLVKPVVLTAFDASFATRAKEAESGRFHHNDHYLCAKMNQQYAPWSDLIALGDLEHVGCRICRFGDSSGPPVVRETLVGVSLVG